MEEQDNLSKFGAKVKNIRESLNLTQAQLAELCGLSTNYIGMIERGERNLKLSKVFKIACSLKVSMSDLFIE